MKKFCFEIYTKNPETGEEGWDIEHVIIYSDSLVNAKKIIETYPNFDCVVTTGDWFGANWRWSIWNGEKIIGDGDLKRDTYLEPICKKCEKIYCDCEHK